MINVKNISFSYEKDPVLNDVSFQVQTGEWLGILGPNGSGKTTLIKCLAKNLHPQKGSIEINDKPINVWPQQKLAQILGVIPQESNILFPFTAFEVVLMGRSPYQKNFGFESGSDIEIARKAMQVTDTIQFANRPIQELSGGERQRIIIARALTQEPKILLMDEPTSFLDIKHQQEILGLLKKLNQEEGLTIISAMHDINLALLYCRSIMLMKNGNIHKIGLTSEVVTYSNLKYVFDTEVYVGINDLNGKPYYLPF